MKTIIPLFGVLFFFCAAASAQIQVVRSWEFNTNGQREQWTGTNHIEEVQVKDGILRGVAAGHDPFFVAEGFEFATAPPQAVEFRYRTNSGGNGELYYASSTEGPYGGFSPKKLEHWKSNGDENWHIVRIFPNWNREKKIIKLRIDFPNTSIENTEKLYYEIDWIRVIDLDFKNAPETTPIWNLADNAKGWKLFDGKKREPTDAGLTFEGTIETEPITFDIDESGAWISLELSATRGKTATITFFSAHGAGTFIFPIKNDGKFHWYNIDGLTNPAWLGKIHLLQLTVDEEKEATVRQIKISEEPKGPAEIAVELGYQTEGINRVGKPSPLVVRLKNVGGTMVKGVRIVPTTIPVFLNMMPSEEFDVAPMEVKTVTLNLVADKPLQDTVTLKVQGGGLLAATEVSVPVWFEKDLQLPKADYVPKPQPVKSDYQIGAFYFPGWATIDRWEKIYNTHPERKPVLGWYDEANPEAVDWQIKWSVENGIQFYYIDWYWDREHQHNDHWVKAFYKAKYKKLFKWAMMWANHNQPESHSEEDQRAVTKFWLENYFNTPEYLTRDGRPVVIIWSPSNMDNDIAAVERKKGNILKKGEGVKKLLDISQTAAKEAGLKGIYFIAMKWAEDSTSASDIQWLKDAGFEMTSIYHFMSHGGKAKDSRFNFQLVIDASLPYFEARQKTGILPFLPNLSTGWDSRPWHGDKQTIIDNRTVAGFRKICEDFKKFSDREGIKDIALAPTNEWGEGSYAEPNAQYGFGMFETIRDVFCKKPTEGWSLNYGPSDVGLGPYDLPIITKTYRTNWDFQDGTQGWNVLMGIKDYKVENGNLSFSTSNSDPAITAEPVQIKAEDFGKMTVRMKVAVVDGQPRDTAQLFWSTATSPVSETNSVSVPVSADGLFHEYSFDLKTKKTWRRQITGLRFDPVGTVNHKIEVDFIRLEK